MLQYKTVAPNKNEDNYIKDTISFITHNKCYMVLYGILKNKNNIKLKTLV